MRRSLFSHCAAILLLAGALTGVSAPRVEAADLRLLTAENPPLNFTGSGGEISGLATEVVRELARRTGTRAEVTLVSWPEGYEAVSDQPDTALFSTVLTAERKERFQWVGPLAIQDTNLYVVRGSDVRIANLDEARKAGRIATVTGYYSEQMLKQEGFTDTESHPDRGTTLRRLLDGQVRLVAASNMEMPAALRKAGLSLDSVASAFTLSTDLVYIAFSRQTSPELVVRWQAALDSMKRDGSFAGIYSRWLPGDTPPGVYQFVTEDYPPVTFVRDGRPAGFVTDIVREIAARLGVAADIRVTSWKNAYQLAQVNPNVLLFSAERTPEREGLFQWVGPVGTNRAILYAKKGSGIRITTLDDARRVAAIATTTNWFTEQRLKGEGFTNLVSSPQPVTSVRQLMKGEVQLSIFTDITVPAIVEEAGYTLDELQPVFTVGQTDFYIVVSRDTPAALVQAWQAELRRLKADGTFEKIYRRYLPDADLGSLLTR